MAIAFSKSLISKYHEMFYSFIILCHVPYVMCHLLDGHSVPQDQAFWLLSARNLGFRLQALGLGFRLQALGFRLQAFRLQAQDQAFRLKLLGLGLGRYWAIYEEYPDPELIIQIEYLDTKSIRWNRRLARSARRSTMKSTMRSRSQPWNISRSAKLSSSARIGMCSPICSPLRPS